MAGQSDHLERLERLLMKAAAAIEANERSRALGSVSAALGVLTMLQVPANPTKQAYYNAYDAGHELGLRHGATDPRCSGGPAPGDEFCKPLEAARDAAARANGATVPFHAGYQAGYQEALDWHRGA